MSFKYINPGYAELLNINPSYSSNIANVDATGKSKTGLAFRNTSLRHYVVFTPENDEFWFKCDVFIEPTYAAEHLYFTDCNSANITSSFNGMRITVNTSKVEIKCFANDGYAYNMASGTTANGDIQENTGIKFNAINTLWLHLKYGTSGTGFLECQINNKIFDKIDDKNFPVKNTPTMFHIYGENSNFVFSNIIISDEYVSPKETIIALPISSSESDMTFDSETGIYTATAPNQTLLSVVDVEGLSNEYGSDSAVTGIALIGNPAYETDNVVTTLTSLTKSGENISENDTIILSSDEDAVIRSYLMTDTTLAALSSIKFGWKAGN